VELKNSVVKQTVNPFNTGIKSIRAALIAEILLLGILIFKGLTARRLYKSLGVKGLINQRDFPNQHSATRVIMRPKLTSDHSLPSCAEVKT
jgi:hypothetical protein